MLAILNTFDIYDNAACFCPIFSWLDGSPVVFTAWEANEPNFANNDENCVTMYQSMGESDHIRQIFLSSTMNMVILTDFDTCFLAHTGYWNDINCGSELPSICKRSSDFVNTTAAPTVVPTGGCPPEWEAFQGKVIH